MINNHSICGNIFNESLSLRLSGRNKTLKITLHYKFPKQNDLEFKLNKLAEKMKIEQLTHIDDTVLNAFKELIPQLTGLNEYPTLEELQQVLQSEGSFLYVAREDEKILGTVTLVIYKIPTGKKAWIEDVVVNESARGKGVAEALIRHVLEVARQKGIEKIALTSQPFRVAANNLYRKVGFELRKTNVYRITV